tara:strand:+ start:8483 stop:8890 length:408 start_codon:yes stop_codon:yes gene_type:complete
MMTIDFLRVFFLSKMLKMKSNLETKNGIDFVRVLSSPVFAREKDKERQRTKARDDAREAPRRWRRAATPTRRRKMDEGLPETTFRSHPKNPTRLCHRVCGDEVRVDDEEKHRRHAEMGRVFRSAGVRRRRVLARK